MRPRQLPGSAVFLGLLITWSAAAAESLSSSGSTATNEPRVFSAHGVVTHVAADRRTVTIRHEAISGYMDAMTMPFKVRDPNELQGLQRGDEVSFHLNVTETESWVDHLTRLGTVSIPGGKTPDRPSVGSVPAAPARHPLFYFKFTNECDQAVSLNDFHGQALAITFFFTRCPVPDFCPRLSKNFEEASEKLAALPGGPTNWHFLSVSFDPAFDTPPVLKAYGERYHYNPARWSFLTGPPEKINELARLSGVEVDPDAGLFNHNFRTIIVSAGGELQTTFPFGGNLSDPIVAEMLKACAATNPPPAPAARDERSEATSSVGSGSTGGTDRR
jgi:protein SCO1/2